MTPKHQNPRTRPFSGRIVAPIPQCGNANGGTDDVWSARQLYLYRHDPLALLHHDIHLCSCGGPPEDDRLLVTKVPRRVKIQEPGKCFAGVGGIEEETLRPRQAPVRGSLQVNLDGCCEAVIISYSP